MTENDIERADRLTRRRARIAMVLGIVFIATQGFHIADDQMTRTVDIVRVIAWGVWVIVFFLFLLYGGGWLRGKSIRALMNDEVTEANRRGALVAGFWATMLTAFLCYALSFYEPMLVRETLHVVITVGVGAAILRFAALERRAIGA